MFSLSTNTITVL